MARNGNRMRGKRQPCMFCGTKTKLTREHIWGRWLGSYGPSVDPKYRGSQTFTSNSGTSPKVIPGAWRNTGCETSRTMKVVCGRCNNGWMSTIEEQMKRLFDRLSRGDTTDFTAEELAAAARWSYLKTCMLQKSYSPVHWAAQHAEQVTEILSEEWRRFYRTQIVPKPYQVALCTTTVADWGGHNYVIGIQGDKQRMEVQAVHYAGHFTFQPLSVLVWTVGVQPSDPARFAVATSPTGRRTVPYPTKYTSVEYLDDAIQQALSVPDGSFRRKSETI